MGHALLKTPGGEELVVVPRAEYDRLIEASEMLADVAAFDRAAQAIADGSEAFIPIAMVDAMLAGENLVRLWRQHRGLTVADLAKTASLSAAYVSQIETGARVGTVETLRQLATALDVDLDDLT